MNILQFEHEDDGIIDFEFSNNISKEAELLIKSLVLGLEQLEKEYKRFYNISIIRRYSYDEDEPSVLRS